MCGGRALITGLPIVVLAVCTTDCHNGCPFKLAQKLASRGTLSADFAIHDVAVPSMESLEVDIDNTAMAQQGRVDAWLTTTDCARLFDQPYPTASGGSPPPLCRVLIGPVPVGSVSSRVKVNPGTYRLFVQGYVSNEGRVDYLVDLGVWGDTCHATVTQPSRP